MAMKIKVHEASSRKYRQHPSDRIGITDDASAYIARKQGLDARAKAWKTCLENGECLHEQGFCNTLSGMLEYAISEIPHSDIDGVRFELDPEEGKRLIPTIWWGWVYDGNDYRIAPDKWVTVETGAGSFWEKAMLAMMNRTIHLSQDTGAIIDDIYARGTDENIEYGIVFDERGMSKYLLDCGAPSIKESAKIITNLVIPIWEILVKASVIADKELVREFNRLP